MLKLFYIVPNTTLIPAACRSDAQGPCHLLSVQAENLSAGGSRAEDTARAGDVPTHIVVRWIDCVPQPAFDFGAENKCVEKLAPGHSMVFGQSKKRGGNGTGGVNDGPQPGDGVVPNE